MTELAFSERSDGHRTVIGRVVDILDALEGHVVPVSLAELTLRTGLPKSTVRRLANAMAEEELLVQVPEGYLIGRRVIRQGLRSSQQDVAMAVQPYLQELHMLTRGQITWFGTLDTRGLIVEDGVFGRIRPPFARDEPWRSLSAMFGDSLALCAAGRLQVANDPELAQRVVERGCPPRTRYSASDPRRLRIALTAARETGYAQEHEQARLGWGGAAAALRDSSDRFTGVLAVLARGDGLNVRGLRNNLCRLAAELQRELNELDRAAAPQRDPGGVSAAITSAAIRSVPTRPMRAL